MYCIYKVLFIIIIIIIIISRLAAKTGQLLKKDSAPWSK
jgi:hypothetical protein